jgi:hypothetical protein
MYISSLFLTILSYFFCACALNVGIDRLRNTIAALQKCNVNVLEKRLPEIMMAGPVLIFLQE